MLRCAQPAGGIDVCAVAIMAKASAPGRTKTRLSPPLTLEQAAQLNTEFLQDIAGNVSLASQAANIACHMAFGPPDAAPFFDAHLPAEVGLFDAWLPDFGACLFHAISTLFASGYGAACVLNSDSPTLPTSVLIETARLLRRPGTQLVIGPSTDGGYYLLGMTRAYRRLFEDIAWSTPQVLAQTLERAAELELDVTLLPPWYDVDDAQSLAILARETLLGRGFSSALDSYGAPRTTATLRRLRREGALPNLEPADGLPADTLPTDFLPTDLRPSDRLPTDRLPTDHLPTDRLPTDRLTADRLTADRLTADLRPADLVTSDRLTTDLKPTAPISAATVPVPAAAVPFAAEHATASAV
jgi:rSAM/selenodomain-associated transferase 1